MKNPQRAGSSRGNRPAGRLRLRLIALLALLCGSAAGVYAVGHGPAFDVKDIAVLGNRHLSEGDVRGLMGGALGGNIFSISPRRLAGDLEASPWVREVSLRKELPDRLVVMVREAEPEALHRRPDGMYLIDAEGRALQRLEGGPVSFLPVIVGGSAGTEAYAEAMALAMYINGSGLGAEMGQVEIYDLERGPQDLSVSLDGLRVKVGKGGYPEKLQRLFELKDEILRRAAQVSYVDLRFQDRVVVKPAAEAEAASAEGAR